MIQLLLLSRTSCNQLSFVVDVDRHFYTGAIEASVMMMVGEEFVPFNKYKSEKYEMERSISIKEFAAFRRYTIMFTVSACARLR